MAEPLPWEGGSEVYEQVKKFWRSATTSAKNIHEVPFLKMLEDVEKIVMEPVPEGTYNDPDVLQQVDRLLGRYANVYSFLTFGYAVCIFHAERFKTLGDDQRHKDCLRKKDALYRLARAVEIKYQASSRMVTVHIEENEDLPERVDVRRRAASVEGAFKKERKEARGMRSWDNVT